VISSLADTLAWRDLLSGGVDPPVAKLGQRPGVQLPIEKRPNNCLQKIPPISFSYNAKNNASQA
jgi:hypothetical protein